jgi:hypothetical protein
LGGSEAIPALSATERSIIRMNSPPTRKVVQADQAIPPLFAAP